MTADIANRVQTFALLAIVFRLYTDSWGNAYAGGLIVAMVITWSFFTAWGDRANSPTSNG